MKKVVLIGGVTLISISLSAGAVIAMGGKNGGMWRHGGAMMGGTMGAHKGMEMPEFSELDTDGDGLISVEDVKAHMAGQIGEFDTDGDGLVSAEELKAHMMSQMEERMDSMVEKMLDRRDGDDDGFLSVEELSPMQGMERMFMRLDADDDGAISQEEFDAIGEKMRKGKRMRGEGKRGGHGDGADGSRSSGGN